MSFLYPTALVRTSGSPDRYQNARKSRVMVETRSFYVAGRIFRSRELFLLRGVKHGKEGHEVYDLSLEAQRLIVIARAERGE